MPDLCCESWTKFSAQTSCGEQDGGHSAEVPDRLHVHTDSGREQNPAMCHIRGNAQWSGDQLHLCARKSGYEDLTKEILRPFEAYGFLTLVIAQCDKEMGTIDVCRKVARERNARTVLKVCAKNKSSEPQVCRSCTRTHSGTRTMLSDTTRDEHWHTAFSNVTCRSICSSLRWICAIKIHSATRRQNAHSRICLEIYMYHLCACLVNLYSR